MFIKMDTKWLIYCILHKFESSLQTCKKISVNGLNLTDTNLFLVVYLV